ncbi:helix-turn-helix domain-containing protein [Marinobacter mobilis]|nr:AraC family transcriptional regulator [Marinobacter mobilis]
MSVTSDFSGLLKAYSAEAELAPGEVSEVLALVGLNNRKPTQASNAGRIPYKKWCELLEALYKRANDPALGVHLGGAVKPSNCGVLGYLAINARTLGEAIFQFDRYQQLLCSGSRARMTLTGDCLRAEWPVHEQSLGIGLSDEVLLYGLMNFFRILLGGQEGEDDLLKWLAQTSLSFAHASIAPMSEYHSGGIGEVSFNQPRLALSMPASVLSLPIRTHDAALFDILNQQADALLRVLPNAQDCFEQSVRDYLRKSLPEGGATLNGLARSLSLSDRTVRRRLAERSLNFSVILQQTRYHLARQYLDDGRTTLSEVALMLGYSEQSAFSRAFKLWAGVSPLQYSRLSATQRDSDDQLKRLRDG